MQDNYQREINYLRISVIDRCNLRCVYCMPPEGVKFVDHKEILRFEEIGTVVGAAASIGVKKVRLTGGEPLVRKGLENLVRRISKIKNKLGQLIPAKIPAGSGPAKYYRLEGAQGTVGFITSMSDHFCSSCNRLRLTSTGSLRPCLYDSCEIDLKAPLRNGAGIKEIAVLIKKAVSLKADRHHMLDGWQDNRVMSQIGG
ncbi:radical SAM protein [Pelotomaculum isophthalicicum JI]|uniref:Radical SAM protein n=1 Tax=Pelotomaculum isophthalicicum JI TaxID=947010 RepID=A0A9X4H6Y1_9FIRM|nr:radical SAM protein [Pelotomaculum isophthalicicum]MDF9409413.1 radical SAM protein [Pelotomaculum isophthalicicum JI]